MSAGMWRGEGSRAEQTEQTEEGEEGKQAGGQSWDKPVIWPYGTAQATESNWRIR